MDASGLASAVSVYDVRIPFQQGVTPATHSDYIKYRDLK